MERNQVIFYFVVLVLFVSILSPILFYLNAFQYFSEKDVTSSAIATVSLTVTPPCGDSLCETGETCSSCYADCGACDVDGGDTGGGTGGGGGGGTRKPINYLLDFRTQDSYLLKLYTSDSVICLFEKENKYAFNVEKSNINNVLVLSYLNEEYNIYWDEVAYFDLNVDGKDDLELSFIDEQVRWTSLMVDFGPGDEKVPLIPTMKKEKVTTPLGYKLDIINNNLIVIISLLILTVLAILIYQHLRLKHIEKTQVTKLNKIYSKYKSKDRTNKSKSDIKDKLQKQKDLLTKAYNNGYVSHLSYQKGLKRINNMLNKIKE